MGKPVLAVLEEGSEVRMLIDEIGCGKCAKPGDYDLIEENIRWFIEHAEQEILSEMGRRGREYLEKNLSKNMSIEKYMEAINTL